jgi:hypothetical protein
MDTSIFTTYFGPVNRLSRPGAGLSISGGGGGGGGGAPVPLPPLSPPSLFVGAPRYPVEYVYADELARCAD